MAKSATKLGKEFGLPGYVMNYYLEKTGYIEKDKYGNWMPTEKGEPFAKIGGNQLWYKGGSFLIYNEDILNNEDINFSPENIEIIRNEALEMRRALNQKTDDVQQSFTDNSDTEPYWEIDTAKIASVVKKCAWVALAVATIVVAYKVVKPKIKPGIKKLKEGAKVILGGPSNLKVNEVKKNKPFEFNYSNTDFDYKIYHQ